jgi:glycosyltransferase involved in cell wall biosynthesis
VKIGIMTLSLRRGGAERVTALVSRHLLQSHDCHLILFDTSSFDYDYPGPVLDLHLPEPQGRNLAVRLANTLRSLRRIARLKREMRFDIVVSSLEPANIPNAITRACSGTPVALWVHEDKGYGQVSDLQRRITDVLIRRLYNRADLIIAVSQGIRETLIRRYHLPGDKIKVIYNPVEIEDVKARGQEELDPAFRDVYRDPVIISCGRLTVQKGQWHLLRAFKGLLSQIPSARLIILGDGELRQSLTDLARSLGIEDRVILPGYQSNPFKYLSRASLFVLPSLWEGFGYVLVESMVLGLPVISTDVRSGPREILAPDTDFRQTASTIEYAKYGILVPPMEGKMPDSTVPLTPGEDQLRQAMVKVLTDPSLAEGYSRQGPLRAADFRTDVLLPAFERLLRDTVEKGRHRKDSV